MGAEIITLIHTQDREKSEQVKVHLLKKIRYTPYGIFEEVWNLESLVFMERFRIRLFMGGKIFPWVQITFWALGAHDVTPVLGALGPTSGESGWFLYNLFK